MSNTTGAVNSSHKPFKNEKHSMVNCPDKTVILAPCTAKREEQVEKLGDQE
jgi:hypothetical protein